MSVLDATRATTTVMSCDATVIVTGNAPDARTAIDRLHQLEARWSRFVPTSEVSRLNGATGQPTSVSNDTMRLVVAMVEAWHLTSGRFDPTMLRPIVEVGYAASRTDATNVTQLPCNIEEVGDPGGIRVDPASGVIQLPIGTALDPGGIGKGLAADIVVDEILSAGAEGALVEIGGDVRVKGRSPSDDGWAIAVAEDPFDTGAEVVRVGDGGIATSTIRRRRWTHDGVDRHHLLDPATRQPTISPIRTCSVIAGTTSLAEACSKLGFVDDPNRAIASLEQHGLAGRLVLHDGAIHRTRSWDRFTAEGKP